MESKTLSWIGIILSFVLTWDKILDFINSILNGLNEFWKTIPPLIILGLIIWLFWRLGERKN